MAIENITELEGALGMEAGKLSEMITSEETHKVDLSGRVFYTKEDDETRTSNIKKEAGTATLEIAIKQARETLGLEFTGKTMDNLVSSLSEKVKADTLKDASIEPDEKYKTLQTDFGLLQTNFTNQTEEFSNYKTSIDAKEKTASLNASILNVIPEASKLTISRKDALTLFNSNHTVVIEDGVEVVKDASGKVFKNDTTLAPLTKAEVMDSFITPYVKDPEGKQKLIKDNASRAKEGSFEAFMDEMEKAGIKGEALSIEMKKRQKDGTLTI